ncbi:hypothetical protein A3Q56_00791 [Intoshia linei]|uniref:CCA tRNA nucleotidyltransferase 1, mitochondrial n=1 Tax=Intoshia linei TaxID=1819745 RepID=A0A177BB69_9BILA|nr:hypothetical protein A3Q56_00791 [Intoshia linei]
MFYTRSRLTNLIFHKVSLFSKLCYFVKFSSKPHFIPKQQHIFKQTDIYIMYKENLGDKSFKIKNVAQLISFKSMITNELLEIKQIFHDNNFQLKVAGGAVRDLLVSNSTPHDLDFATTATPAEMVEMFNKLNIRMFNFNGEKHGTVTIRYKEKNYEITTLRIDRLTDGRHAKVEFITDWYYDALRRDLTVNSLFLDFDGNIHDYFNGIQDIEDKNIQFVGNPNSRIQEDYLRIFRYFRFFYRLCDGENHNKESIEAINDNRSGIERVSGERIYREIKLILSGKRWTDCLIKMHECELFKYIGLPNVNLSHFKKVSKTLPSNKIMEITKLVCLFDSIDQVEIFRNRCKISNFEYKLLCFIIESKLTFFQVPEETQIKIAKNYLVDDSNETSRKMIQQTLLFYGNTQIHIIDEWKIPKFPVTGTMLLNKNVKKGPFVKSALDELKKIWKDENFLSTSDKLLQQLNPQYIIK